MAYDLFLSYSRADRPLAEGLVHAASNRGLKVWFDANIEGGDNWRQEIVDELSNSLALIIIFSKHTNGSKQVIKELAIADSLGKKVIPVLVTACEPKGAYLYELAHRNWIKIYPNPETRLPELVEKLREQLGLPNRKTVKIPPSTKASTPPEIKPIAQAGRDDAPWFPLERYDLILIPVLLVTAAWAGPEKPFFFYMLIIAVRHARLNRGFWSVKSFSSYLALFGLLAALSIMKYGFARLHDVVFYVSWMLLSMMANIVQAVLRWIFQAMAFRENVAKQS